MEDPLQIMVDVFKYRGMSKEDVIAITSPLEEPEDQLNLAEWMLNNEKASRREIIGEVQSLMRNRMEK